jgi:hypothetical protein
VPLPANLLEALTGSRFSAVQLRLLLWVVRHTYGWNRLWTRFSWYGIAHDLHTNRGTVFRAGVGLLKAHVLHGVCGRIGIQTKLSAWKSLRKSVAAEQRWITPQATPHHPLPQGNGTVAVGQRFFDERKTGVKTERQRRRGGGYVDNAHAAENDWVRELLNFYGALRGKALSSDEAGCFRHSAKALLEACLNNLQEAKALLAQSFAKSEI